ncbi:MAG TPA: S8 family serine peptidase [Thermoanaerobaculia bacterium]|nr:S8 family serine peptidase [Thermoanaerobaculia bacterium]
MPAVVGVIAAGWKPAIRPPGRRRSKAYELRFETTRLDYRGVTRSGAVIGKGENLIPGKLLALACLLVTLPATVTGVTNDELVERIRRDGKAHVVVTLRPSQSLSPLSRSADIQSSDGFEVVARFRHLSAIAGLVDGAGLEKLLRDDRVERIDLDVGGGGGMVESLPLVGGNIVQLKGISGRGVTVAVLDTGVNRNHPALQGRVADEQCFCRNSDGSGCCPNGQTTQSGSGAAADDHGHGTNVTGVIASSGAGAPVGMAPGVDIIAVKVLDRNNRFVATSQILSGLDWLIENHPEVRVVNMSLLTEAHFPGHCDNVAAYTRTFALAINVLRQRGASVFACSGNTGSLSSIGVPACIQNSISVGAVYDSSFGSYSGFCTDTAITDKVTCFSDSSTTLDLLAPGSRIVSAGRGVATSTYSGTSQASPHAAGAAALMLEINPGLNPDQIEALLKTSGRSVVDQRTGVAFPRIDVAAAAEAATPVRGPRRRAVRR